ncbi:MAG: molybdopterin-guanine dinucleotide biosynthesis protein B [Stappia sp.]|uniref:molybdopterin-guanine dinucleotide biosynthesis protein B n=1 Tax=Stappia sp. TaxID=1870903 RepID=UPI000C694A06|nr:molybdopterin-guanine dinucleotide biosynthesis protein B [Stappia sp.]MAA99903.1 molybdopterin-guanine dinucleotide biosynthesis protein B [Stappia sp.]MBM20969.1 molybdopterin-guanine dinucleotide biosynthesis protein B [Stappia sp.]|tara:strand:+ start:513 stop:1055 length:543 start_codon:yes stop_codon:yes gene_type:complete
MSEKHAPVVGVSGWKNSGKTTLVERLVAELTRRGHRVATVKKAHHNVDVDTPGTDSHRHRLAGAREVALVSSKRIALMRELGEDPEPTLEEVLDRLAPCDVVLVEGYKKSGHPKIEVRRKASARDGALEGSVPNVRAIAADHAVEATALPVFDIDDVAGIADFITDLCALNDKGDDAGDR